MSHNLESMFYVSNEQNGRFVPWHGLGTAVDDCLCSVDAITKAGLDWEVLSQPVHTESGLVIPNYKANVRSSDNKVLGIVTDRYKIVQNKEAFNFTDTLIGGDVKYETAGSLNEGRRIWLLAKMPTTKILDDEVEPYLCFTSTHDGTGSIKACMTPVRVVCNNTLNLALDGAKRTWSMRHMGNIEDKIAEARYSLGLAHDYMGKLGEEAERLVNIKVTEEQINKFLDELFPVKTEDSDRKKKNAQEMKDSYMACWFAPDLIKFLNTGWGAVNAMADMVGHKTPSRNTQTYAEKNFERIIDGHVLMDSLYDKVVTLA